VPPPCAAAACGRAGRLIKGWRARAGACSAFVQYFQDHQDQANAPDQQFRQLAYNAPYPSQACCAAAQQFVSQKCSCDGPTLGNAQQARARRPAPWWSLGVRVLASGQSGKRGTSWRQYWTMCI
jgi:hypothetical protein